MTFWLGLLIGLGLGSSIGLLVGLRLASWADHKGREQVGEPRVAYVFCPRCGRLDGTHSNTCERSRIDQLVAPARRRDESPARGRGYAGGDGQDRPQSDGRATRPSNFGTTDRRKGDAA